MGKWTGAVLQMIGAGLLFGAGAAPVWEPFLIFGLGFGVAGLWSWDRGARRQLRPPPPPAPPEAAGMEVRMARLEDILSAMQSEVGKLAEDREFYDKLYAGERVGGGREV